MACLNCGKPLGSRTELCYRCASDGIAPEDVVDVDRETIDRLEQYFVLASIRCHECGDLHTTVTVDGETYTAADFDIDSLEAWQREMERRAEWIRRNRESVREALCCLEAEWPETVAAVRDRYF